MSDKRSSTGAHRIARMVGEGPAIDLFRRNRKSEYQDLGDLARAKRLSHALATDKEPLDADGWSELRKRLEFLHHLARLQSAVRSCLILRMTTLHPDDRERATREIDDVQRSVDAESARLLACDDFLAMQDPGTDDELREQLREAVRSLNESAGD